MSGVAGPAVVLSVGSVALLVAVAVLWSRARSRVPRMLGLLTASGVCGLLSVLSYAAPVPEGVAQRLWILGGLLLLPLALALYPDDRPPVGVGWLTFAVLVAVGLLGLLYPASYARTSLSPMLSYLALGLVLWWRHEHAAEEGRRAILWLALGGGVAGLIGALAGFVLASTALVIILSVVVVLAVGGLVVGLVAPDRYDVRALCVSVVVHLVTGFTYIAVYGTVLAALDAAGHPVPMTVGPLGLIAALCAWGYHPITTLLRGVIDRLLFGDRRAPLDAASRVSQRLGDEPVIALRALRESLALPYAALVDGEGRTVAATGTRTTRVVALVLLPLQPELGMLEVGLRVGDVTLPVQDQEVLTVLVPALAQLMHARALSAELQTSRAAVVAAVEEERRRLRRDLHDGLGPRLTGVAYTADAARNLLGDNPERTRELLIGLRAEAGAAIAEIRSLVEGLRPSALDQVGLTEAIRQHARGLRSAEGAPMTVTVEVGDPLPTLGAAVEVTAYRIVVEALTNAARHSGGRTCRVDVRPVESDLRLEVSDDGCSGIRVWVPGVGMTSMRERAELLGGTFEAFVGTTGGVVRATLPAGQL